LKQVLINLLSNAIKYNRPHGAVEVVCSAPDAGRIRITVKDTGQGLSPDQIRQLFQPFNRLGQERNAEEGTGIGLVMSKLLVELMGGEIGVRSTVGIGSEFWYDLNAENDPMFVISPWVEALEMAAANGRSEAVRTILYVEDNPANLELVSQLVGRRPDLYLLGAENATVGLRLAREKHPEVILMDINLPGISGIQALKLLREDPSTWHIPVIALSANAMTGDIKKGLEAGFFRYITKPIVVSVLMQTIDEALEFEGNATLGSK
jgi:CheY-like chemotaxis protein